MHALAALRKLTRRAAALAVLAALPLATVALPLASVALPLASVHESSPRVPQGAAVAEDDEGGPEEAPAQVVESLVAEFKRAKRSKSSVEWIAVFEKMSAYTNPEFAEPALTGLKYRASRDDKKAAKAEAETLGDKSKARVNALVLERVGRVQAGAARVIGNQESQKHGKALLSVLEKKGIGKDQPLVASAIVDAMGRMGYRGAQEEVHRHYKRFGDRELLKFCVRYFGQVKTTDLGVVRSLCNELAAPQPSNVNAAFNPPASYWEERWNKWMYIRRDVTWALREITGKTFQPAESEGPGDSTRALAYVKEHARELGLK